MKQAAVYSSYSKLHCPHITKEHVSATFSSDAILLVDKLMSIANNDVKGKHTSVHSGTCDIFVKFGNLTGGIFFRQIKDEIQTHKVSGDSSLYRSEKGNISN